MGVLRVVLALSVLMGHATDWTGYRCVSGLLAVQCFFIISGFYMGLVLNERYDTPRLVPAFYANRALRIYGIYLPFLLLHLMVFGLAETADGASPLGIYRHSSLSAGWKSLLGLSNITLFGQDVLIQLKVQGSRLVWTGLFDGGNPAAAFHFLVIPAAWSLALELTFYLIAPWVVRRPVWQIAALGGCSLVLRAVAAAYGFTAEPWNARFFPFELALFLLGTLSYRAWAARREAWDRPLPRLLAPTAFAAILLWSWWGVASDDFFTPQRLILLVLVAAALPAIHGLTRRSRADRAFGELSFPIYLGHLLVYGMTGAVPVLSASPGLHLLAAIVITMGLGWLVTRTLDARIETVRRHVAARAGASPIMA